MFDRHISRRLTAYIDGDLAPLEILRAETHLAQCGRCRDEFEQARFGVAIIERLPLEPAPESVWRSIEGAFDRPERPVARPTWIWRLATAAALVVLIAAIYWHFGWQPGMKWEVVRLEGSPAIGAKRIDGAAHAGVGEWIETDASSSARIKVGKIGSVDVGPNSRVRLLAAPPGEHRLGLRNGQIHARISAPPRLFFVETASGTAVDLGCEYTLASDIAGSGLLHVTSGWVSFEWQGRESLVPAGAKCRTQPRMGPGTPYFEDAPERFTQALESFDSGNAGGGLELILSESRIRDTLTLWHLLSRVNAGNRPRIYDRMAELSAPPEGVSREQVLKLDPAALQRWREELAWTW